MKTTVAESQIDQSQSSKAGTGPKTIYAMGSLSDTLMANIIFSLAMPIYNIALGVSPILLGYALCIPRIWEAFTDPVIGNISDNTRTKWGRRRPFIFIGAILTGILCAALWIPPLSLGKMGLLWYFLIISILYFTAYAIFTIPYNALGLELSSDYNERTSVMAYKTVVMNIAGILFLPWAWKLCYRPEFGKNEVEGVRVVGAIFGLLMIIFGLIPAIFCRERHIAEQGGKIRLLSALKHTVRNKSFMLLGGVIFSVIMGIFLAFPLLNYINIAYIYKGDREAAATMSALYNTVYGIAGLVSVPLITMVAARLGKKAVMLIGMILIIFGFISSWFLFTPRHPSLQLVLAVLFSPGLSCAWVISAAMLADVCDIDELQTGMRREGMYGASFAWLVKLGIAGVMAASGYVVSLSGFASDVKEQAPGTITFLRIAFAFIPIFFISAGALFTILYPLSKERLALVQSQLLERKTGCSNRENYEQS